MFPSLFLSAAVRARGARVTRSASRTLCRQRALVPRAPLGASLSSYSSSVLVVQHPSSSSTLLGQQRRGFSTTTTDAVEEESPRESMSFDVLIVGGGPAGLAASIRLKQLCAETGQDLSVCLIDKGRCVVAIVCVCVCVCLLQCSLAATALGCTFHFFF